MKTYAIGITLLIILLVSLMFVQDKYQEMVKIGIGTLHSSLRPVYLVDDVPQEYALSTRALIINNQSAATFNGEMNVLSWNIWRNYNSQLILDSLQKIGEPDIIFFQEAQGLMLNDSYNGFYVPLHQVKQQDQFYTFSHTGQLILSKYPFIQTEIYPLPTVARSCLGKNHLIKRVAIYAQIQDKDKTIGLYNIHLENCAWESGRTKQIQYILPIIEQNNDSIVIIGGDFNTWLPSEEGLSLLEQSGFTKITGPKFGLFSTLDYFFIKGALVQQLKVEGEGSDHQPVYVQIKDDLKNY